MSPTQAVSGEAGGEAASGDTRADARGGTAATGPGGASEVRRRGIEMMQEVYGFSVDPAAVPGGFAAMTIDHLFGEVWTRPGLDVDQRRLITIGALAALGQPNLLEIQFGAALEREEISEETLREIVVHLAHYVGWPMTTGVNEAAERVIARRSGTDASAHNVARAHSQGSKQ